MNNRTVNQLLDILHHNSDIVSKNQELINIKTSLFNTKLGCVSCGGKIVVENCDIIYGIFEKYGLVFTKNN